MNSEFELYKSCDVVDIRFYVTEYYDKKLYFMHVYALVDGEIRILYFPHGDKIGEIKRKAELYYKGGMKHIDVCRCLVQLEQKYFVRDLQTGSIRRDETGKPIQIDKYLIYAGVYPVENNSYEFIHGNDPTSQCDHLKKRGIIVLSVNDELAAASARFYSRELSSDELLK